MKTSPIVQDKKATTASAPAAGQKSNVNTVKQQPQSTLSPLSKLPNGIKPTPATAAPAAKTTTTAKPAAAVATKPLTNVKSNLPAAGKPAVATAKPGVKPATTTAATKTVAKPTTESTKSLPPLNGSGNSNTTHSKVNNLKINMDEVLEDDNKEEEVINKQIESSVKKFDTGTKSFVVNIRYVGRGNCAVVYKGVHVPSLTIVAIKEVKIIDEAIRKQFINELNALSCNRVFMTSNGTMSLPPCPFIVSFYDVFNDETKGRTCIVMEYMDGGSLQDIIAHNEGGIRDENALYNISYAIMKGINYLHSRHMIHRDIKPSNLLINHFGDVKLSDFGIVKELCNSYGIADTFVGTLPYMSPSRISAEEYSYGSDIWSFGLSIYVLAKGEFPYDKNKDYWTILEQIKDNPAPRLSTKEFSKEFCNFIEMCLNKDESKIPTINQLFSHPFFKGKKPVRSQNPLNTNTCRRELDDVIDKVLSFHMRNQYIKVIDEVKRSKNQHPPIEKSINLPIYSETILTHLAKQIGLTFNETYQHYSKRCQDMINLVKDKGLLYKDPENGKTIGERYSVDERNCYFG